VVTVEFALTVPLLFMIVFAAIEFSRVNVIRHTVDNAAYEGARDGVYPGATAADVRATAQSILNAVGTAGAVITVTPSNIQENTPEVTVRVEVPLDQNGWIFPSFFAGRTLTGSSTLAREEY
jgi:Flp pilus assembly protein TadG